ncbi:MAG TPA: translocation/assembly module TamB domain-containing protein [Candidatus Angelobacter sp.]|nr:translocation/assembly module TamB domain-containing protein [Candidatus Angelobacter sp.]
MKKWKKIVLWAVAVIVVLIAGAAITLVQLLEHSRGFRQDILAKVERSVQESTGAKLEVRDFNVSLSHLSLDLYNVVVHGREADPSRPLLQADHLQVGLAIDSLLHKKWHVRNIAIDHPVVRLAVNKAGENNLPKPEKKSSGSKINIFDLAIGDLKLDRGEIYYNDQKTPLSAEVHDLNFTANYQPAESKYSGELGYNSGRIVYGAYAPLEHNLQATFGFTQQTFSLDKLTLAAGKSTVVLSAAVNNYSSLNMQAEGNYEAMLATSDFQRILKNPSVPAGMVRLAGHLQYQAEPNRPMLETVSVAGTVSSAGLAVKTPSLQTEVRDLYASYKLAHGNAEVKDIRAHIMGGTLSGKLTIRDVAGAGVAQLQASVKDLSLEQAQTATRQQSMKPAHLSGKVSADATAHWAKTLNNLAAHADATLDARLGQSTVIPLDGVIHADYAAAHKELALTKSYVRTPKTTIHLDGKVSDHSQLQVAMNSSDLHELERLANTLRKSTPGPPPQPLGLYGTGNMTATVSGSTSAPQIKGQLDARNLRVKGSSWKVLRTNFTANPSQASLSNGDLEAQTQGQIKFSAQARLKKWTYVPSDPIAVNLSAAHISVADLAKLANQNLPVTGTLSVDVALHGSQLNPQGQGTITVANAKVATETVKRLELKFHGNGNTLNTNLVVQMPAGTARASVDYFPKNQGYKVNVQAQNFRLEKLQTVQSRNMQIAGSVNLNVNGEGTIKDPQLQATLDAPQIRVKDKTIPDIKLQTTVKDQVATIALDSALAQAYVKAHGTVGIRAPYEANLQLDTGRIDFQPLLAIYAPTQAPDLSGQTELHATLRGPLAEKARLQAHVEVPTLGLNYKQFQLAAAKPIHVDYQNGTVTLQPTSIRGTGTTIDAQAVVPLTTPKAAMFLVKGNVDLQIAELFVPGLTSKGQLQFDVDSRRYGPGANLNGQIRIVNANFHTLDSPVGLDHANGTINVTQTRMEIASFEGQVGGGTITAKGAVAFRPGVQFQLNLEANNIRVRYPEGVRVILASNLTLAGTPQASAIRGQVKLEHVSFTPDFDITTFASPFNGDTSDSGTPSSFTQGMKLDITVQSTSQMNLSSSQVSLRGNANLHVVGTAAAPVILGRANLTGGEFFLAGNRYQVRNGTIDFINPVRTEPVLNLQVRTTISQYNITLGLHGPMERLETTYTSDPALPPVDVIRLIATGKTESAANAAAPTPPALGAESLVASGISSQVSSRIGKLAGISQLQIDPGLGTDNGQSPGARIAIQQRVTSNLFVTYATDVTSTQRQAIQVEYKFNPKWSVSGIRDQNGGFGVDGKYHKDF